MVITRTIHSRKGAEEGRRGGRGGGGGGAVALSGKLNVFFF